MDSAVHEAGRLTALTRRERQVLSLVAEGLTSAEVANRLVLSERTVHAHLRAVFTKLGVRSRAAATRAWCDTRAWGDQARTTEVSPGTGTPPTTPARAKPYERAYGAG